MQSMTAADVYGTARPRQPSNNAAPAPIEPGGNVRTEAAPGPGRRPDALAGGAHRRRHALIASVRFEVEVSAE